jgi:tRNA(fMet)-specific endonuclease VapC
MVGKILDSNIVIDLFRKDASTIETIRNISLVYIPVVVLGELYYGANLSSQKQKRKLEIEGLSNKVIVLDCTKETAFIYGGIKAELKNKGKKIPENDIWIAAIAIENNLPLLTNDKHFGFVDGLRIEKVS